jgi:hypothetical protein
LLLEVSGKICWSSFLVLFFFAGERTIVLWDQDGNEVGRIERQENENLHCMLNVANRIVTASSLSSLYVYNPETWSFVAILAYHRESVTKLCRANQTQFASGSLTL